MAPIVRFALAYASVWPLALERSGLDLAPCRLGRYDRTHIASSPWRVTHTRTWKRPWLWGDIEGHHGSLTSTSGAFVDGTSPEHALISVGRSNRYGHPAQFVLVRLSDAGAAIHRTDE